MITLKAPIRILICGSRNFSDSSKIERFVNSLPIGSILIEGEANGADKMAALAAQKKGVPEERILRFPADWENFGRAAGPIRNSQMLLEGKPQIVVAFSDNIEESRGTKNMMQQALKKDLPVFLNPNSWFELLIEII